MDYTDLKRRGVKVFTLDGQYDDWGMIDPDTERFVLWDGDWVKAEDAQAAIAALEAEVERMQELLDLGPLGRIGLTLRTRKALRIAGIKTLDKLRQTDEATLLRIPNLGRKGLNDIRAALADQPVTGSPR